MLCTENGARDVKLSVSKMRNAGPPGGAKVYVMFHFALHNLRDLSPTSRGCLGGSIGRATALKAGRRGFKSHLSSLCYLKIEKSPRGFLGGSLPCFPLKPKST